MSIHISVNANPVSIRKGSMLITDLEDFKKNEISRRRRLRLEQVRHQSKDIANKIRQRIRGERDKQLISFDQKQNEELQKLRAHKLLLLQQHYQDCLDEIGTGHIQAAQQPDVAAVLEAEHAKNQSQAEERGREAIARVRQEQEDTEEKKNSIKEKQKFTRTIEDLRSAMVASLGKKSGKETTSQRLSKETPASQHKQPLQRDQQKNHLEKQRESKGITEISIGAQTSLPDPHRLSKETPASQHKQPIHRDQHKNHLEKQRESKGITEISIGAQTSLPDPHRYRKKKKVLSAIPEMPVCSCGCADCICQLTTEKQYTGNQAPEAFPPPPPKSWTAPQVTEKLNKVETPRHDDSDEPVVQIELSEESSPSTSDETSCTKTPTSSSSPSSSTTTPSPLTSSTTTPSPLTSGIMSRPEMTSTSTRSSSRSKVTGLIQSRVHFYDHTNRYENKYDLHARVERILPHRYEPDARQAAQLESQTLPDISRNCGVEAIRTRVQERSNRALEREKLRRDYKQLLGDLQSLAREERLIRSTRAHSLPPEIYLEECRRKELCAKRQRNMDSAFESVYHKTQEPSSRPSSVAETTTLQTAPSTWEVAERESLPAVLNVGEWQSSEKKETHEPTAEDVPTLENLLERVKIQRSALLKELSLHVTPTSTPEEQEEEASGREIKSKPEESKEPPEEEKLDKSVKEQEQEKILKKEKHKKLIANADEANKDDEVDEAIDRSVTHVNEYSFNMSLSKTSDSSTSTSYEGVKIVVSVSELTEKTSYGTKVSPPIRSPRKQKKLSHRKTCRRIHKNVEKSGLKRAEEKATMTTENGFQEAQTEVRKDREEQDKPKFKKWHNEFASSEKELSESSTTYLSPPRQVTPSHGRDLSKLLASVQQKEAEVNPLLTQYIMRLLAMSRESVDNLGVSTSDISTIDIESDGSNKESRLLDDLGAIETLLNTVREKTKMMSEDPQLQSNTCATQTEQPLLGQNREELLSEMQTEQSQDPQTTPTPSEDLLHSSCFCEDISCDFNITAPHFTSIAANGNLEEYQSMKFPEMFTNYSEKCSKRISELTKSIEQIRDEKKKLIETSSGSSSSSGLESTEYLSPPDSFSVMTRKLRGESSSLAPTHADMKEDDGRDSLTQRYPHRTHPHVRPPPTYCPEKLQWDHQVKELSTILEGEFTQLSQDLEKPTNSNKDLSDTSRRSTSPHSDVNDTFPDVMSEMLKRGLISSPPNWLKERQAQNENVDDSLSISSDKGRKSPLNKEKMQETENKLKDGRRYMSTTRDDKEVCIDASTKMQNTIKSLELKLLSDIDSENFAYQILDVFKQTSCYCDRNEVKRCFKSLGFKLKTDDTQFSGIDMSSVKFRQLVVESFRGLNENSRIEDLIRAFRQCQLLLPGETLHRLGEASP